ncbi:hypothetical protein KCU65_g7454, partial [Aureobasidium melanogenum]
MQDTAATMEEPAVVPSVFRLMDLPTELIKIICNDQEFKIKDLKALRLTNKLLCEAITDRFAEKCFHEIAVAMSRPSLQAFNQLSQHPRLGPYVSRIKIFPILITRTGRVTIAIETMQLSESRDAERMLGISFGAFAERKQAISLAITDDVSNLVGVSDHNCKILGLKIQDKGSLFYPHASAFFTDKSAAQLESVCSQLTLFHFEDGQLDKEITSKSIKRIVKAAKQLKELHLLQTNDVDDVLPEIIKDVASRSLEKVTLAYLQIHFWDLIAFLNIHKQTLTELDFSVACIMGGTIKDLIAWIKENLAHLRCLVMEEVCNHPIGSHGCPITYSCTINPHEDMQTCLADILNGKRALQTHP